MTDPLLTASATNLRRYRKEQDLTFEQLSERSGIARTTLVKWEAGQGNPTLATLGAAASALGIEAKDLIAHDELPQYVSVVPAGTGVQVGTASEPSWLISTIRLAGTIAEFYEIHFEPDHEAGSSTSHGAGSVEHVYVVAGNIEVGPIGHAVELHPGDFASYPTDGLHQWRHLGSEPVRVLVVLMTPFSEAQLPASAS